MKFSIALVSFLAFFLSVLWAEEPKAVEVFWCQGEKISRGDTTYFVLKQCGPPAYREDISAANEGCEKVEKWHYDCIGRGYIDEFTFRAGVLVQQSRGEKSRGVQECR